METPAVLQETVPPAADADAIREFSGIWVNVYSRYIYGYEEYFSEEFREKDYGWLWTLSDDGKSLNYNGCEYAITEEDGVTVLICYERPLDGEVTQSLVLVRKDEARAYLDQRIVEVEVTKYNVHEYICEPEFFGTFETLDSWGDPNGKSDEYYTRSAVYDDGMIYFGKSFDFAYEAIYKGVSTENQYPYGIAHNPSGHVGNFTIERARGKLFFIKAEYVADNSLVSYTVAYDNSEHVARVLTLTNGVKISCFNDPCNWRSSIPIEMYDDWKY